MLDLPLIGAIYRAIDQNQSIIMFIIMLIIHCKESIGTYSEKALIWNKREKTVFTFLSIATFFVINILYSVACWIIKIVVGEVNTLYELTICAALTFIVDKIVIDISTNLYLEYIVHKLDDWFLWHIE